MSGGKKNDQDKPDLSLIPKEAMWEMGKALTHGAKKYGKYNFKEGMNITRLTSASLRHTFQFLDGEDIDEETQCIHLGNAMASLAMAIWMLKNKPEFDDRYKDNLMELINKMEPGAITYVDMEPGAITYVDLEWPDNSTE